VARRAPGGARSRQSPALTQGPRRLWRRAWSVQALPAHRQTPRPEKDNTVTPRPGQW